MCSYTSSESRKIPVPETMAESSRMSASESIAPDGLCGLLTISIRVRGVIASRTRCQSGAKLAGSSGTCTARAPARSIAGS